MFGAYATAFALGNRCKTEGRYSPYSWQRCAAFLIHVIKIGLISECFLKLFFILVGTEAETHTISTARNISTKAYQRLIMFCDLQRVKSVGGRWWGYHEHNYKNWRVSLALASIHFSGVCSLLHHP